MKQSVDFTRCTRFTGPEPLLAVAPGLPPGRHVIELVVEDDRGRCSLAARVVLVVLESEKRG